MKNVNKILTTLSLSASDTREDTIKSIIRTTLLESKNPITLTVLKENIDIIYDIELYEFEFNSILKKLTDDNEVLVDKDLYSLSQEEKSKLIEIEAKLKSSEILRLQNFRKFIDEKSPAKLEDADVKLLWNTLKDYLYGCFFVYGTKAIEFLHPQYVKETSTNQSQKEVFLEAVKKLGKQELTNIFRVAIEGFPDYATKEDLDFIDEIGQKTLSFASLGLSPEQATEDLDVKLIDWILYLDTNVLFSILDLHSNNENDACKELLKLVVLNKDTITIKFRFSELTLKELRHKKSDFASLDDSLTESAIRAILKSEDLDEFARKYYSDFLKNREGTIHPTKIIDLAEITLPKSGIEISRNQKQVDSFEPEYVNSLVADYQRFVNESNVTRQEFAKKNNYNLRQYFKSESQMKHDVILREMILSSRRIFKKDEVKTFNEIKYFGLTLDELLIRFDNNKNNYSGATVYPTFFKPSFLLNKLVKLLPIKTPDYKKAFLKAVSSRGFHRDIQKSNDIICVASYLKTFGIDNENVLLNLISEKLFMDKFRQESSAPEFNSGKFFESELNKILSEKELEVSSSKTLIAKLAETSQLEKEEKDRLKSQKEQKESDIIVLTSAVNQLKKQVKKLSERPSSNLVSPKIDFESAQRQKELDDLKTQLENQKDLNLQLENKERKPLRIKFIKRKLFWWRFRSFVWIFALPIVFLLLYLGLRNSTYFPAEPPEGSLDVAISTAPFKGVLIVLTIVYQAIFISIFSSKFFQTNKSNFIERIELPDELKEVKK